MTSATLPLIRKQHGYTRARVIHENTGDYGQIPHRHRVANERMATDVHQVLVRFYPGHKWAVFANVYQGIAQVKLYSFSNWSEIIKLRDIVNEMDKIRAIKNAGGNWLTRYGFAATGFDLDKYLVQKSIWMPEYTRNLRPPD